MKFEEWMEETGLSQSSIKKYSGAIRGPLSKWATEADIVDISLIHVRSYSQLNYIVNQLKSLPIFLERNKAGHQMYSSALNKFTEYLIYQADIDFERDLEQLVLDSSIKVTEKINLLKSRVGQGKFRKDLLSFWNGCSVTGYKDKSILIASHIKPWSISSNLERMDKFNGLLLLPNLDKVFDRGLVSFDNAGKILISPYLRNPEELGIFTEMRINLHKHHSKYISHHRKLVFRAKYN